MTAVVLLSPASSPLWMLIGLAVILGASVLIAHWGACRPQAKRVIAASVIAATLSTTAVLASDVVMLNSCDRYTSNDWQYWYFLCWLP